MWGTLNAANAAGKSGPELAFAKRTDPDVGSEAFRGAKPLVKATMEGGLRWSTHLWHR